MVLERHQLSAVDTGGALMAVKPIPDGYPPVIPYLIIPDPARQIAFLTATFGARETGRHTMPDGSITHAEVRIGESVIMMGGSSPQWPASPGAIYVYVEDTDATYQRALAAGATSIQEPRNQWYGDRGAGVKDEFGNQWFIGTHIEEVSPEEMQRRSDAASAERAKAAAAKA
jgi:PhnB protein